MIDTERLPPLFHEVVEPTGIDLGVKCFATLSDNTTYEAPKPLKKAKIKLAKLQWRHRRKQLGNSRKGIKASANAQKFYTKQARLHAQVSNQRKDYLQKTTTTIARKYSDIPIEDLNVRGMVANRKLSAAISDLGFYEFRLEIDRDLNAAINLSRYVPSASGKLKFVDSKEPTPSDEAGKKRRVAR